MYPKSIWYVLCMQCSRLTVGFIEIQDERHLHFIQKGASLREKIFLERSGSI